LVSFIPSLRYIGLSSTDGRPLTDNVVMPGMERKASDNGDYAPKP